jgi:hypothetical protein
MRMGCIEQIGAVGAEKTPVWGASAQFHDILYTLSPDIVYTFVLLDASVDFGRRYPFQAWPLSHFQDTDASRLINPLIATCGSNDESTFTSLVDIARW